MLKDNTLRAVKQNIANGDLGLARQRLHTLTNLFPYDLALRRSLGDVYHKLQYPERAGCYWFLEEKKTAVMERACAAFVKSCGGHPFVILRTLKFRGGVESLPPGYAREVLEDLNHRAPDYRFPELKAAQIEARKDDTVWAKAAQKLIQWGCLLIAVGILAIFATGIYTIYTSGHDIFEKMMR